MPIGYMLDEFEIVDRLGNGGFSVVYKVFDHRLQTHRALKEYMPRSFAMRQSDLHVHPMPAHRETFQIALRKFVEEGRTLVKFDHPSLIRVLRTIDANGTAYMVMNLVQGRTLDKAIAELGGLPEERWLLKLLEPLTAALEEVHGSRVYHRDIKPENIMVLADSGRPLLLDFGAAREVAGRSGAATGILTPGYAPIEQYAETGMEQGPWTDIYGLGATLYKLLTGAPPQHASQRQAKDTVVPLAKRLAGQYSAKFLKAIDHALVVDPEKRTRSIAQFRDEAGIQAGMTEIGVSRQQDQRQGFKWGPMAVAGAAGVGLIAVGVLAFILIAGPEQKPHSEKQDIANAPAARTAPPNPDSFRADTTAPPPSPPPPSSVQSTTVPTEPRSAFEWIVANQDPSFGVSLELESSQLKANKTPLRMRLTSKRDGWFYVLVHDVDGRVLLLYPNKHVEENRIQAGKAVQLPPRVRDTMGMEKIENMTWAGATGTGQILAVISGTPIELGESLAPNSNSDEHRYFLTLNEAKTVQAVFGSSRSYLTGKVKCTDLAACSSTFGASKVEFWLADR